MMTYIVPHIEGIPEDVISYIVNAYIIALISDAERFTEAQKAMLPLMETGAIAREDDVLGKLGTAIKLIRDTYRSELRARVRMQPETVEPHALTFGPESLQAQKTSRTLYEDDVEITETTYPSLDTQRWKARCPKEFLHAYERGYVTESSRLTVKVKGQNLFPLQLGSWQIG